MARSTTLSGAVNDWSAVASLTVAGALVSVLSAFGSIFRETPARLDRGTWGVSLLPAGRDQFPPSLQLREPREASDGVARVTEVYWETLRERRAPQLRARDAEKRAQTIYRQHVEQHRVGLRADGTEARLRARRRIVPGDPASLAPALVEALGRRDDGRSGA
jgi:hypothetical protein